MSDKGAKESERRKSKQIMAYRQQEAARTWNQINLETNLKPLAGGFFVVLSLCTASNHGFWLKADTPLEDLVTALEKTDLLGQYLSLNTGPCRRYTWGISTVKGLAAVGEARTIQELEDVDDWGHTIVKVLMEQRHVIPKKRTRNKEKDSNSSPKKRSKKLGRSL